MLELERDLPTMEKAREDYMEIKNCKIGVLIEEKLEINLLH